MVGETFTPQNCVACKKKIPDNLSKYLIFQKDFLIQKRLVYKINHLTGEDFENSECVICPDCRIILIQIFDLEKRFVDIFKNESAPSDVVKSIQEKEKVAKKINDSLINNEGSFEELVNLESEDEFYEPKVEIEVNEKEALMRNDGANDPIAETSNLDINTQGSKKNNSDKKPTGTKESEVNNPNDVTDWSENLHSNTGLKRKTR